MQREYLLIESKYSELPLAGIKSFRRSFANVRTDSWFATFSRGNDLIADLLIAVTIMSNLWRLKPVNTTADMLVGCRSAVNDGIPTRLYSQHRLSKLTEATVQMFCCVQTVQVVSKSCLGLYMSGDFAWEFDWTRRIGPLSSGKILGIARWMWVHKKMLNSDDLSLYLIRISSTEHVACTSCCVSLYFDCALSATNNSNWRIATNYKKMKE